MFIETFLEFKQRMGVECRFVRNRYLFQNGAESDGQANHREPPEEEFARLKLQQEFLMNLHDAELDDFNRYKQSVSDQATLAGRYHNLPGPPENAPELLREGAKRIAKLRKEIEEINARLAESPEVKREQQRAEVLAGRQNDAASLNRKIADVSI